MINNTRGFTLIETLTVLTILCVILLIAQANMSALLKKQQADRVYQELQSLVSSSRAYAIRNRRPLTLCGSSDGLICNNNWNNGLLLFEDGNRNGAIDNADVIVKRIDLNLTHAKLQWQGFGGARVTFESMGITYASNGTFTYCQTDKDPLYSRQVIISRGARARLSYDKNGDGLHDNTAGNTIICP